MFKYTFNFGTSPILIFTKKELKESIPDEIFKLVQFIKYDFNHRIHNSSGYRFNDVKKNITCELTPEFIYYLKLNLIGLNDSGRKFNPFISKTTSVFSNDDGMDIVEIDGNAAVKKSNFVFDTKLLLQPFTIDSIYDLLRRHRTKNFYITSNSYSRSDDEDFWDVEYELEEGEVYKDKIKGQSIGLNFNDDLNSQKKPKLGFSSVDIAMKPKFIILKTQSAVENKIMSYELRNLLTKYSLQNYAKVNEVSFTVVDEEDNRYDFE